ncbi:MAG: Methyltransferase type 11 [Ilumatobacteraceae bacterium]|nr:Methyltransferase type 11 [Ilumatobacteraceae bacterium]
MELDEYRRMAAAADHHWWYRSTRELLGELLGTRLPAATATTLYLDAAGGTGATGRWLADRATTVLADWEPYALATAPTASAGYRPVRADLNALAHPDATFDAVLCVTALYHQMNADPQATVRELVRVCRPGGLVCLMEPGVRRLRRPHDVVTHAARRFSRSDLAELVRGADLELVRATGAYTFLIPPAAALAVLHRGEATSDVDRHEGGLGGLLGVLARAERAALRHVDLPFGLSVLAVGRKPGG